MEAPLLDEGDFSLVSGCFPQVIVKAFLSQEGSDRLGRTTLIWFSAVCSNSF